MPNIYYQLRYMEKNGEFVRVYLIDNETPVLYNQVTNLIPTDEPFVISAVDNDLDKFKVVRAKQATISFVSTLSETASIFSSGSDTKWSVVATVESTGDVIFKGFLLMDGHQQPFLPASTYNVTLIATDNLGTLDEIELTRPDGTKPIAYFKIIQYLAWALQKTGLQLDIVLQDTWVEETETSFLPAFNKTYLWSKTFEGDEINTWVDCQKAIEIICKRRLTVQQVRGQWWIQNIDEKQDGPVYRFRFDYEGTYIEQLTTTSFHQAIGRAEDLKLINKDAILSFIRPHKFIRLTYNYNYPKEIIDNIDFSRGPENTSITVPAGYKAYDIADWTLTAPYVGGTLGLAYIRRKFENGYEKERSLIFDLSSTPSGNWNNLNLNRPMPLTQGDKFNFSIDLRYMNEPAGGSGNYWDSCVLLRLNGDDGNIWLCGTSGTDPLEEDKWTIFPSGVPFVPNRSVWSYQDKSDRQIDPHTLACSAPPAPVSGELIISIMVHSNTDNPRIFDNMRFDYIPYINGSYQKYTGQYFRISQDGNYKANIDDEVFVSDAPRRLFKGAMFKKGTTLRTIGTFACTFVVDKFSLSGDYTMYFKPGQLLNITGTSSNNFSEVEVTNIVYESGLTRVFLDAFVNTASEMATFKEIPMVLTSNWYAAGDLLNQGITPPIPTDYKHPFGHLQAYAVWNQYNRQFTGLDGSVLGMHISDTQRIPDLTDMYQVNAAVDEVTNKWFTLCYMEQEYRTNKWKAKLIETVDSSIPKDYASPIEFVYKSAY